ncbi:MAG: helix-turn-helix domain-containing protein, partial [Deltaproteobacteria bacterium]|nr:helix-turn-helix domain-containing protein [Deltaproteobacteria bacterium]
REALARAFPTIFSGVAKKRHIAKRTGLELLDEEDVKKAIHAMRSQNKRITPETRKARRFLIEQLIARGHNRENIATTLGVSVKTVYNTLKAGE